MYKNYYQKNKFNDRFNSLEKTLVKESGDVVIKSGGNEIPFKEYYRIICFGDY